jgi:predicted cation transporter
MPETTLLVRIRLPLPEGAYLALALPAVVSAAWLMQGHPVLAAGALTVLLLLLLVGQKFELDGTRRYRDGWHWAHWLNPAWQPLPVVQQVLVKPYRYRMLARSKYGSDLSDAGIWEGYTVLLSVPNSRLGVVVASVESAAEAAAIAAEMAAALGVPWQQV